MKTLLFEPPSPLVPAFASELEGRSVGRRLDVFVWEGRLLAFEKARELWWCTLDVRGERDVREFWAECVKNERVGRIYSVQSGFRWSKPPGALLQVEQGLFYVVVAGDNSGIARLQDHTTWQSFPAGSVRGVRNTLANRPTIWAPGFHARFALRSFASLGPVYENEVLKEAPDSIRLLWTQGAKALPLRLVAAALSLGWMRGLKAKLAEIVRPADFWKVVLEHRALLVGKTPLPLPTALLQSSEVALPGHLVRRHYESHPTAFNWHDSKVELRVNLGGPSSSAHERLEHRLELRDWLVQFFPRDEVESWFDS